MTRTTLTITLIVTFATVAPAQNRKSNRRAYPPSFPEAREEIYKTVGDAKLRLYVFEPEGHKPGDSRPAIVFFFGGGWRSGSPAQFYEHCKYLASRGMVAMTADYRVSSRHGVKALACVADAKSAIRWVRANAKRLGVDPDRIVAGGGSAGGHTAACTGVVPGLDEPGEDSSISSVPNAMALFNPAVLLAPMDGVTLDPEKLAGLPERVGGDPKTNLSGAPCPAWGAADDTVSRASPTRPFPSPPPSSSPRR